MVTNMVLSLGIRPFAQNVAVFGKNAVRFLAVVNSGKKRNHKKYCVPTKAGVASVFKPGCFWGNQINGLNCTKTCTMEAIKLEKVTLAEYLEIESAANEKYEFLDGFIYAMAGGTYNHGLICGNIFSGIKSGLKEKNSPCFALSSEIKLAIQSENSLLYPDTMVICGDAEMSLSTPNAVTNPLVIVEVLSKSTASYDRGDKFFLYQQLTSIKEYILIEQDKAQIEIYKRENDLWKITRIAGLDKKLRLASLGLEISLMDIYERVVF